MTQGLASVLFETSSTVGPLWGGLEILWAVTFLVVAYAERRGLVGSFEVRDDTASVV